MVIYVEYAFLENFLFDSVLLSLALFAARVKIPKGKVAISAACGGIFALAFPLLRLSGGWAALCKFSVGALLCMIPFQRLQTGREWKRYALTTALFFTFSFAFGGSLLGVYSTFSSSGLPQISAGAVFSGFALLTFFSVWLVRKLYRQKMLFSKIIPCRLHNGEKSIQADGFLDSGNLARKNGLPVCFVSPDLMYDLFQTENMKWDNQVCDEMTITTLAGEKRVAVYLGEIEIENRKMKAYFALSRNMIGREYKILLNGGFMGETYETD